MKGFVPAGELEAMLLSLTKAMNKQALPINDRRMISCPIRALAHRGWRTSCRLRAGMVPGTFSGRMPGPSKRSHCTVS